MSHRLVLPLVYLLAAACANSHRATPGDNDDTGDDNVTKPNAGTLQEVTICPGSVPAATSGVCDVTAGGAPVFLRSTMLAPKTVYQGGSVLIKDGAITCTGCNYAAAASAAGATTIDCTAGIISP